MTKGIRESSTLRDLRPVRRNLEYPRTSWAQGTRRRRGRNKIVVEKVAGTSTEEDQRGEGGYREKPEKSFLVGLTRKNLHSVQRRGLKRLRRSPRDGRNHLFVFRNTITVPGTQGRCNRSNGIQLVRPKRGRSSET